MYIIYKSNTSFLHLSKPLCKLQDARIWLASGVRPGRKGSPAWADYPKPPAGAVSLRVRPFCEAHG